jgi:hypothetical protein
MKDAPPPEFTKDQKEHDRHMTTGLIRATMGRGSLRPQSTVRWYATTGTENNRP